MRLCGNFSSIHVCNIFFSFCPRPPTLKDLESLEPAFYSSLLWIRENDPAPLDLTFTVEEEAFGQVGISLVALLLFMIIFLIQTIVKLNIS